MFRETAGGQYACNLMISLCSSLIRIISCWAHQHLDHTLNDGDKGAICNVPIDVVSICNTLPRPADINVLVIVKLKRKLEYKGHVCEGSVSLPFSHVF